MIGRGLITASFAARPGAKARSKESFVEHLPPLVGGQEQLQVDATPLILHGHMIMDKQAFDFITCSQDSKAAHLARQLADFEEAGVLQLECLSYIPDDLTSEFDAIIESQIKLHRRIWLREVRRAIEQWEILNQEYLRSYGRRYGRDLPIPYAIRGVLDFMDAKPDQMHSQVRAAIFSDKTKDEKELTNIAIRSVAGHALLCHLNNDRFGAPVYEWANMQRFLTVQDRMRQIVREREEEIFRFLLINTAHVDVQGLTTAQIIKLLKDKEIANLREFVRQAALEGNSSAVRDLERITIRAVALGAKVVGRRRSFVARLASAVVKGAFPTASAWVDPGLVADGIKTFEEFMKDSVAQSLTKPAPSPADAGLRSVYILHKHLPHDDGS